MVVDVGQVVAGKYELVRLLGRGAMGEVWLANHRSLGEEFAIKLIVSSEERADSAIAVARFKLEAQIASKLSRRTRHVVSVTDYGEDEGIAYLVMERLEGESLEKRLARGPLPIAETAAILQQIARALAVAHEEEIVHRDLKPANVWLGRDEDDRLLVKLVDFGVARAPKLSPSPIETGKQMVLGSPAYMSPEQARGEALDRRCDLWALAVVAYEALSTRLPFDGVNAEATFLAVCTFQLAPLDDTLTDAHPGLSAFFAKAFARDLNARFADAAELSQAFEDLVPSEELERALGDSTPPSSDPRAGAPGSGADLPNVALVRATTRRSGGAIWFGLLALAALVAFGPVLFRSLRRVDPEATFSATSPPKVDGVRSSALAPPTATAPTATAPTATAPTATAPTVPAAPPETRLARAESPPQRPVPAPVKARPAPALRVDQSPKPLPEAPVVPEPVPTNKSAVF